MGNNIPNDPRWRSADAFRRQMSYRSITEWREAELADAQAALVAAEQRLQEAHERGEYLGWTGRAGRAHDEAQAQVSAARRRVWRARWRSGWAAIRARFGL